MKQSIAVIGAGHVGSALAFDLADRGFPVTLRSMPGHDGLNPKILANNGSLTAVGEYNGQVNLQPVMDFDSTAKLTENIIFVAVPSQGHSLVLSHLSRYDLSDRTVIFITGNAVAVKAYSTLKAKAILDTATSPYSSRVTPEGGVSVRGIKERLQIASLPAQLSEAHKLEIQGLFRMKLEWKSNLLEIFLSGVNGVVHVPTALLNLGWIEETNGDFYFYRQGMSEGVCSIIESADKERLAVAAAYNCFIDSALETYNTNYGEHEPTLRKFVTKTEAHNRTKGVQKRFLSQDVPFWLVPCSDLGRRAGVSTPIIDMLILLASTLGECNYRAVGRTLKSMGLENAGVDGVLEAFKQTERAKAAPQVWYYPAEKSPLPMLSRELRAF